ncbi:MAG: twin-arginine translocation signal domain-containing protein [Blastocatellia bacterium]
MTEHKSRRNFLKGAAAITAAHPVFAANRVMAAIRMGVDAYRRQTMIHWDGQKQKAIAKA